VVASFLLVPLCAIQLSGVTGTELRARAFFDANNVKVGDPMQLTIDFIGQAEFRDIHPPSLRKAVAKADWKIDDVSAKTDTFRDARRLVYRVRPMREGVLWFPSLEFEYAGPDGKMRRVRANEIPVHAKGGAQVVVAEMAEDTDALPQPPELVDVTYGITGQETASPLNDDEMFGWRKALSKPTADAFAAFDIPAARMNEATCAIREGNWARAFKIYQRLEWSIGQTEEIERGLLAALAQAKDDPSVELPIWRQVLRPLLRFGWKGRVGIVLGGFAALALLFWLLGRGIRAIACVVLAVGCVASADARDIFEEMQERMNQMQQQMQNAFSGGGFGFSFGGRAQPEMSVTASLATDSRILQVGDSFHFIVSLEAPRTASIGQVRLVPSETFGLTFVGQVQNLTDVKSANPSNVIHRLAVPVRYDVPFRGKVAFSVEGMVSGRQTRRGGGFSLSFSNSFRCDTQPVVLDVKPLPSAGQPADFTGIVSEGLVVRELCDILRVETNDVVTISYRLSPKGYVPDGFLPRGAAFEWTRQEDADHRVREIEYRRFFVADGSKTTPELVIPYYDPRLKKYREARTGGTPLSYEK